MKRNSIRRALKPAHSVKVDIKRLKPRLTNLDGNKFIEDQFLNGNTIEDNEVSFMGDSDDSERLDIKSDIDKMKSMQK